MLEVSLLRHLHSSAIVPVRHLRMHTCIYVRDSSDLDILLAGQSGGSSDDEGVVVGARSTAGKQAYQTFVQVEELQKPLCGQSRPHFFRGVATVHTLSLSLHHLPSLRFRLSDCGLFT